MHMYHARQQEYTNDLDAFSASSKKNPNLEIIDSYHCSHYLKLDL